MIIAQVGCSHGELDRIYNSLQEWEKRNGEKIDLVLAAGDFQSLRDNRDMDALKCPDKFKRLGDFCQYFNKQKVAPFLTLFIGGNHEASNLLRDLYYGGWVAENIYFMGYSGVFEVSKGDTKVRVAGISGIEKDHDSQRGYFEEYPYVHRRQYLTSMYHIREFEISKLTSVREPVDLVVSHEWPTIATAHTPMHQDQGISQLVRFKPYFKNEIK